MAETLRALRRGGVVLLPSETTYGLFADPTQALAVAKIFALKQRPHDRTLPLIAGDAEQIRCFAKVDPFMPWASLFWPGPLTTIVELLGDADARGLALRLLAQDGTVAVRVPRPEFLRRLCLEFGGPLTSTSANLSGEAPATKFATVAQNIRQGADLVWECDAVCAGNASTLVRRLGAEMEIVRQGILAPAVVRAVFRHARAVDEARGLPKDRPST